MAISRDDLLIAIQADTSSAKVGIESLTKSVEKLGATMEKSSQSGGKIESALTGMAGKVVVLNQAFELAGRVYGQFIKPVVDSVVAFQNSQDAVNKLSGTLNLLGEKNIPQTVNQFVNLSNAIEDMIGVDDKAVLSMLSMAKASGLTNAQVEKLAKTAADFSVGAGIGFEQAFFALQKTLKGSAIGVATFRPELKNLTEEQLKAGDAIDYISGKYQGYSQIIEKSFGMSISRASEAIDDIKKAFGGLVSDFIPVQSAVDGATRAFSELSKFIKMIPKELGPLSQAYQILKSTMQALIDLAVIIIEQFDTMFEFVSNGILVMVNGVLVMFNVMTGGILKAFADLQKGLAIIGLIDKSAFQETEAAVKKLVDDTIMRVLMVEKSLKGMARAGVDAGKKVAAATTAGAGAGRPTVGGMAPMDPQYLRELETLRAKTIELQTAANSFGLTQREQIAARLDGELKILEAQRQQYLAKKQTAAASEIEAQMAAKRQLAAGQIEAAPSRAYESIVKAGQDAANAISGKFSEGLMGTVAGAVSAAQMIVDAIQGLIDAGPKLLQSIAKIFDSLADLPTALLDGMMAIDTALQKFIDKFPEAFARLLERLPTLIANILENLGKIGVTLQKAIIKAVPPFVTAFVKESPRIAIAMAKGFAEAVRDLADEIFSGDWKLQIPEIDTSSIEKSVAQGVKNLTQEASKTFAVLDFDAAKTRGESAGKAIDAALVKLNNWFTRFLESFAQLWRGFWELIQAFASAFSVERIRQAFVVVFSSLKNILMIPVEAFRGVAQWFANKLGVDLDRFIEVTGQFFTDLFGTAGNTIAARFSEAISSLGRVFEDLPAKFINIFDQIIGKIKDALKIDFGGGGGGGGNFIQKTAENIIKNPTKPEKWIPRAIGGLIYAQNGLMIPRGTDVVPAMLTPGEFIMSRSAVNRFGQPFMDQINSGLIPAGAGSGSTVVNVSINIENTGQLDDNFIRSRLMPTIRNEFRRASLDGQFVISGKGVR